MGLTDLDFVAKEWPMITGAPHLFFGGIFVIAVFEGMALWLLFSWVYRRHIDGMKAQFAGQNAGLIGRIEVYEDRLKCAAEKVELANRAKAEVETQFNDLRAEISATAENGTLAERVANVEAAIGKLSAANTAIGVAVGISEAIGIGDKLEGDVIRADKGRPK